MPQSTADRETRQFALDAALKTALGGLDADGVVAAAVKYHAFLTGTDPE